MAKRKTKKVKADNKAKAETADSNVIVGNDQGRDVVQQTKEARGEHENTADLAGKAGTPPHTTPEMEARDKQIEERRAFLEEQGASSNDPGSGLKKVEKADVSKPMYKGMVTCTSVHAGTHEKISCRIDLPEAVGEERVWLDFKAHHANAMREHFKIDPTNTDDPNLRSRWE